MISIIICSRNSNISSELRQNIAETIGCEHELVIIDNSTNNHSIFNAYNEGVKRSKGEILCFCHDDIIFHSTSWGSSIEELFKDDHIADVVAVDGVCFFIPKELFPSIRFDNKTYNGFHAYDMDISMQVQSLGKRVCVTDLLTVEHFWSEDSFKNQKYIAKLDDNLNLFYQKWKNMLPIVRGIDEPDIVIDRLNNLCIQAYDATKVRKSKAYRLGRMLLKPFKLFK